MENAMQKAGKNIPYSRLFCVWRPFRAVPACHSLSQRDGRQRERGMADMVCFTFRGKGCRGY